MRAVIIGLVFVAIILAGGTAYLLRDFISAQQAELAAQKPVAPTTEVLVANSDLPVGTVINAGNTVWMEWPEGEVPEGFLEKTDDRDPLQDIEKTKHLARRGFVKGEPITMTRLYKSEDPGFLRGSLAPGMRAIAVRVSAENAASGFILPNDRVDMLLTHNKVRQALEQTASGDVVALESTSETILTDLRVLAVDQKVNEFEGGATIAKTILLEVTPHQAEMINTAKAMGSLSLTLRSAEQGEEEVRRHYTTDIEVSPLLRSLTGAEPSTAMSSAPAPMPAAPVMSAPSLPAGRDLTIYRGGQAGAKQ